MKSINLGIALLMFATALSANAAPLLNGLALEQEFNKDRYIAAIYSETLSDDADTLLDNNMPRRLEVRIVTERLSARRLRNQWMEGIAINNSGDILTGQANNMVTFANMFQGRLQAGDRLTIDFAAATGTTSVSLNDIMLGMIEDREFFNTLLRAWIGPIPPSTDFRDGLMASGKISSALLASFEALRPSGDRVAQIAQMVDPQEPDETQADAVAEKPAAKPAPAAQVASATAANTAIATVASKPKLDIPAPTLASLSPEDNAALPARPQFEQQQVVSAAAPNPKPLQPTTTRPAVPEDDEFEEEEDEAPLTADMILARQIYHSVLLRHTFKHIRYPKRAQDRGQEGSVRLNVTIDSSGRVKDVQTLQDSRYSSLNREALEAIERAGPYPATPPQLGMDEYRFSVPITFRLPD